MAIPEKYKSDHLLLLVGGNPLPNAIAARLLVKPDATISLLHSEMSKEVAQRLQAWLLNTSGLELNQYKVRLVPVDEVDPQSIAKKVQEEIQKIKGSSVGLHYTGGTKIMVAHAYRMALKEKQKSVCFSYLDARRLQMIFDPDDPLNKRPHIEPVGLDPQAKMSLQDLLALHGWAFKGKARPKLEPILPASAKALAEVYGNCHGDKWEWWLVKTLYPQAKRSKESVETAFCCPHAIDKQICYESDRWQSPGNLKKIIPVWPSDPELANWVQTLKNELEINNSESSFGIIANTKFNGDPEKFCKWLEGEWLESWALQALKDCAVELDLHDVSMDLNMQPEDDGNIHFQLDTIAVQGYRFFAISCSTDHKPGMLKLKLFEAYQRARQLGGDEARIALVCSSPAPLDVQQQVHHDLDTKSGRIRVFGRCHLVKLVEHLSEWMKQQPLD